MGLVVLKLGGSLLACPDVASRLRRLISGLGSHRVLIVVGGGSAADVVRDWSRTHALSEESAHWIALRSLTITRALVQELLPECAETNSQEDARQRWSCGRQPLLLDIEAYLRQVEATSGRSVPHTWNVTSDSIAAFVAVQWRAEELVLLKSTDLESGLAFHQAAQCSLVDAHFPEIAPFVSQISWCNLLRDSEPIRRAWQPREWATAE